MSLLLLYGINTVHFNRPYAVALRLLYCTHNITFLLLYTITSCPVGLFESPVPNATMSGRMVSERVKPYTENIHAKTETEIAAFICYSIVILTKKYKNQTRTIAALKAC